jgi:bifunctional DNase/RNase
MTQQPPDLISMHVAEIRRTAPREGAEPRHVVFLEDAAGGRRLPIWVGAPEATALAVQLDDVRLPRPTAYQFAASLLAAAGGSLAEVRVAELTDSTFYAQAILADGTVVDARPSDALTLALIADAPIYVHAAVLEQTERERSVLGDLIAEAENATDDARTLANEVRARLNATSEELAELRQRLT